MSYNDKGCPPCAAGTEEIIYWHRINGSNPLSWQWGQGLATPTLTMLTPEGCYGRLYPSKRAQRKREGNTCESQRVEKRPAVWTPVLQSSPAVDTCTRPTQDQALQHSATDRKTYRKTILTNNNFKKKKSHLPRPLECLRRKLEAS